MDSQYGGGSKCLPAISKAKDVCLKTSMCFPDKPPAIVLITDGHVSDAAASGEVVQLLFRQYKHRLIFHVVGFGEDFSRSSLETIAAPAGTNGHVHETKLRNLASTFTAISNERTASSELFKEVGDKIASEVKMQLANDFL